ncbi:lantibiotic dehydratase family protein [Kitasatospora sp. NBC_01287]|uniref:lantibiotic dehydratase n=1 Tax=Kitasatospora sp. NBC_01287 TaxID=2903573 RepID=UPI002254F980|nr:lantibiotic dehydratase [Kitasatospora sp. NBC_01287]MCX4745873.1 lantibiotic dehydratase family protein [Kitasatospora sp. NBC_01287]
MPHPAGPSAAPGRTVRSAPYALARATALAYPRQCAPAAGFRAELAELVAVEDRVATLLPELGDALYASRGSHPETFHREVVLPLRRALHNGREVRPALLARLGDLPERVPPLAAWLALRERRTALAQRAAAAAAPALAAERAALSALCREPALGRALALTSADLLRAVERAAAGATDRKARKEEPTVLRYALRASTKTSPLSWFTAVGWGALPDPAAAPEHGSRAWSEADWCAGDWDAGDGDAGDGGDGGTGNEGTAAADRPAPAPATTPATAPASLVGANRTLVSELTAALLDLPRRRDALAHRMTSTARIDDGRANYIRDRAVFTGGRMLAGTEDEVALTASRALTLVAHHARDADSLAELARRLTTALGSADGGPAVDAYLAQLAEAGLLVPAEPVDPQHQDPLTALAQWLRGWPEDTGLADRITELARTTAEFADAEASRRPALLTGLTAGWTALLAEAGRPVPTGAPLTVLTEDVVAGEPLRLDAFLGRDDHRALGELTALTELFDLSQPMRRVARDLFVARYGVGGSCPHPWEFGPQLAEAWEEAGRLAATGFRATEVAGTSGEDRGDALYQLAELADFWSELRSAAAAAEHGGELVLPVDAVAGLADRLPVWMRQRPSSYAYFVQREPAGGLLCVNHVYGGWGRFTSRFLTALDPAAAEAVARQIRRGLGEGARAVQIRPVGGFNANLHPLLVPDELGTDPRRATIDEAEVDLVHDEASDQIRVRLRSTGELLDVLYSGFLAPIMLPHRLGPFLNDHPEGVVDFRALAPPTPLAAPGGPVLRTPRLRHRHLVLQRARWQLGPGSVQALRADLAAEAAEAAEAGGTAEATGTGGGSGARVPVATVARWRAQLGLPEQLFLHPAPAALVGRPTEDYLNRLRQPKPQLVDLGNALHLRSLAKWLARHPTGVVLEEALPAPGGCDRAGRAVELVVETYRAGPAC